MRRPGPVGWERAEKARGSQAATARRQTGIRIRCLFEILLTVFASSLVSHAIHPSIFDLSTQTVQYARCSFISLCRARVAGLRRGIECDRVICGIAIPISIGLLLAEPTVVVAKTTVGETDTGLEMVKANR